MKNGHKIFLAFLVVGTIFFFVDAQNSANQRFCYNFSWLGPRFNNETEFNGTCDEVTQLNGRIPCRHPLIITDDGSLPDLDYLWTNYPNQSSCNLIQGEVCAKYSFKFDGFVQNVTYMCTKVLTDDDVSITSGCYTEVRGNRETEVCICRTILPGQQPCSSATRNAMTSLLLLTFFLIITNGGQKITNLILN